VDDDGIADATLADKEPLRRRNTGSEKSEDVVRAGGEDARHPAVAVEEHSHRGSSCLEGARRLAAGEDDKPRDACAPFHLPYEEILVHRPTEAARRVPEQKHGVTL